MHIYTKIYQFAASVGALEGYVYKKQSPDELDLPALTAWIDNICQARDHLPAEALAEFQADLDRTLGRAVISLKAALGENDERIGRLQALIRGDGRMPVSADDFNKRKWFEEDG
ncbi:MAG: hypothetical protein GXO34_04825 [Deltaproteobacteria bacterium]|nr:hypothetical protein [Deltaproteobacteria bacterium]